MDYQKQFKEIVDGIDHKSFNSLMTAFENILDILENISGKDDKNTELIDKMIEKSSEIKSEAATLLMKEREEIISTANKCGIPLSEIGINLNSDDDYDM